MGATADVIVRSRKKGEKVYQDVEQQLDRLKSRFAAVGLAAGGAALAGITALTVKSFESADALAKTADKIGVGTQNLASLNRLAVMAGGSVGGMQEALVKATKRLGEFNSTGGGAAAVWLKRLNLDTRELATLSPDQLFARYSEAIGGLNNRGEQLAAISALMGDESRSLIGLVDQGAGAFAASEEEVERYGLALNRIDSAKIEAANDAVFKVKERFTGIGNVIASKVAPVITAIANRFLDSGTEADVMGDIVDKVMDGIATGAGIVADVIFGWKLIFAAIRAATLELWATMVGGLARIERAVILVGNKMASIFGGEQIDPESGFLSKVEDSLRASSEHAGQVLAELAAAERPSVALARALAQARIEAENTAQATAKAREKLQEISAPTFEENTAEEKAREREEAQLERQRETLQRKVEAIEQSLLTEEEREIESFERRQEILEIAIENNLLSKERAMEIEAEMLQAHQDRLKTIEAKGWSDRQKFDAKSGQEKAKQVFGDLANITAGVAQHNKTLFQINKTAAIANAIINTALGITKTLATYPMPLAAVMAAVHAAAGIAQIAAISSTQFGGGSTPSAVGTVPTINDQPLSPFPSGNDAGNAANLPRSSITIIVEGNLIGDEGLKQVLADTIGELVDQDEILISPESRQAAEIRSGTGSGG